MSDSRELATVREGPAAPADVTRDLAVHPVPSAFDPPDERFDTRGLIGRGGMGTVHEAFDRSLGRPVAIKTITSQSPVDLARFEREAQITARLEHPGIVPIHDAGRHEDGSPYYVMRKVDGRPLDQLVDRRTLSDRLALVPNVLAACDALAFAHAKHVIHRDLKPTNILVGPFGETLVIDWGLARTVGETDSASAIPVTDPNLTRAGVVAGTPGFMAPEQARGERVDPRSDVYALGATLFYVLAGKLPFATTSATEMIEHVGADRAPDWGRLPPELPADLRAIVAKAMSADADARYPEAGAMAADLRRFVTGNIVGAHRYGIGEQLLRFFKRNRAAVAITLVALAVILGGGGLSVRRILAERDEARVARKLAEDRRLEADDRADELLVRHAHELALTDPAGAIAALRRLRPESKQWRAATIAATNAYVRGVPAGFSLPGRIRELAAAPTTHQIAVSLHTGEIDVIDLDTREKQQFTTSEFDNVRWVDDHSIAISHERDLEIVQLDTREVVHLAIDDRHFEIEASTQGIYVFTHDGNVYRVASGSRLLGPPVAQHVTGFATLATSDGAIVRQGSTLALVSAAGTQPLPGDYGVPDDLIFPGAASAVARTDKGMCLWRFTPAPVFEFCAPIDGVALPAGDMILDWGGTALTMVKADHRRPLRGAAITRALPTRTGWYGVVDDGSIWVRSNGRLIDIGRGPYSIARADVTADGDYFIVGSVQGEIRFFRLADLVPTVFPVGRDENAVALTSDALFTSSLFDGVIRYDRKTRAREIVLAGIGGMASVSLDGQWVVSVARDNGVVTAANVTSKVVIKQRLGEFLGIGATNLYSVTSNGTISRFDGEDRIPIATVPGAPTVFRVGDLHMGVILEDHRLCRFALADGKVTCTANVGTPDNFVLDKDGTVWILTADQLTRWTGSGVPQPVTTPTGLRFLGVIDGVAIVTTAGGVLELTGQDKPKAAGLGALTSAAALSDHQLAVVLPTNRIGILDLPTGQAVETHLQVQDTWLAATGRSVAYGDVINDQHVIAVYDFPVPLDPVELRAWLQRATNAIPVPGSDVVSWP